MSQILDTLLAACERKLPETKAHWLSDLRSESAHIPAGFARLRFQWSGLLAAIGQVFRVSFGPQKMGQFLLGTALLFLCIGCLIFSARIEDHIVRTAVYFVLPLYSTAGIFALSNLTWMKRYTAMCCFLLGLAWLGLSLDIAPLIEAPREFLRAFAMEAAVIMAGLCVAATYLGWVEESIHA